jgi:hypothetical protein
MPRPLRPYVRSIPCGPVRHSAPRSARPQFGRRPFGLPRPVEDGAASIPSPPRFGTRCLLSMGLDAFSPRWWGQDRPRTFPALPPLCVSEGRRVATNRSVPSELAVFRFLERLSTTVSSPFLRLDGWDARRKCCVAVEPSARSILVKAMIFGSPRRIYCDADWSSHAECR